MKRAYELGLDLVKSQIRFYGNAHPDTIETRMVVLDIAGRGKFVPAGLVLKDYETLATDARGVLDPKQLNVLLIRSKIAYWTREAGAVLKPSDCTRSLFRTSSTHWAPSMKSPYVRGGRRTPAGASWRGA